jgi:hypothetical protein
MRKLMIAALLGGQLLAAAQPALAADFAASEPERMGAFGGVRVRMPLGGSEGQRQVRAGLTVAPTLRGDGIDGERPLHIGEGVELGYRAGRPLSLSVAGMDVGARRLGAAEEDDDDGPPTWALIAGGVVILVGLAGYAFVAGLNASSE